MHYSVAVFDLDGTLLDTSADLQASVNYALLRNGLPTRSREEVKAFIGNGIRRLVGLAVPAGTPAEVTSRVFQDFSAHYAEHSLDRTAPYDGIPELLAALRADGVPCCVVSNKVDSAVQVLIRRFFPELFDVVVGEREAEGIRRKPAPDTVLACMRELGVSPRECVYIGDSEVDLATASNAGCDCISVTWGFRSEAELLESGATVLAHNPPDLRALVV